MSKEATSCPIREQPIQTTAYEVVTAVQTIADMIQLITKTITEQMALVTITLNFEHEGKAASERVAQVAPSTTYFLENMRALVTASRRYLLFAVVVGAATGLAVAGFVRLTVDLVFDDLVAKLPLLLLAFAPGAGLAVAYLVLLGRSPSTAAGAPPRGPLAAPAARSAPARARRS